MKEDTCIIRRTGRRATSGPFELSTGKTIRLNATGTHVWDLTPDEQSEVAALPDTAVIALPPPVGPIIRDEPKAKKEKKAKAKDKPSKAKKAKE